MLPFESLATFLISELRNYTGRRSNHHSRSTIFFPFDSHKRDTTSSNPKQQRGLSIRKRIFARNASPPSFVETRFNQRNETKDPPTWIILREEIFDAKRMLAPRLKRLKKLQRVVDERQSATGTPSGRRQREEEGSRVTMSVYPGLFCPTSRRLLFTDVALLPLRIRSDYWPRAALPDEMRVSIAPNWRRKGIGRGETPSCNPFQPSFRTQFLRLPTTPRNGSPFAPTLVKPPPLLPDGIFRVANSPRWTRKAFSSDGDWNLEFYLSSARGFVYLYPLFFRGWVKCLDYITL